MLLFQTLMLRCHTVIFCSKSLKLFFVAGPHELKFFLQQLLALLGPFRKVEYNFPANTPSQLPNFFSHTALFSTALAYESNQLLHADPHYHVLVLYALLCVSGRTSQFLTQPLLQFAHCSPLAKLVLYLSRRVIARFAYFRQRRDDLPSSLIHFSFDLLRHFEVHLRDRKLRDLIKRSCSFQLWERDGSIQGINFASAILDTI
jgi:hypothetical protein